MDKAGQKGVAEQILRKAGVLQPPSPLWRRCLRRAALVALGAMIVGTIAVWVAVAGTAWHGVQALFDAGFDLRAAGTLLYVSTLDNLSVAAIGGLGAIVGAISGFFVEL